MKTKTLSLLIALCWLVGTTTHAQDDDVVRVAALRVENAEVRMAAPPDWFRADVSRSYPSQYFFERDPREVEEGRSLGGSVIQVSLLEREDLLRKLDADNLPPARERAIAYLNTMLSTAPPELIVSPPQEWDLTDSLYAVLLATEYPSGSGLHSGGTIQQTLVIETNDALLLVTIYAPLDDWDEILPVWKNILSSIMINGEPAPMETIMSEME